MDLLTKQSRVARRLTPYAIAVWACVAIGCAGSPAAPTGAPATVPNALPAPAAACQGNWAPGSMTASVDGSAWRADCVRATLTGSSLMVEGMELGTATTLRFVMQPTAGLKAGIFGANDALVGMYVTQSTSWWSIATPGVANHAVSGSLVSATAPRVTGTFAFDASGFPQAASVKAVTAGTFDVEVLTTSSDFFVATFNAPNTWNVTQGLTRCTFTYQWVGVVYLSFAQQGGSMVGVGQQSFAASTCGTGGGSLPIAFAGPLGNAGAAITFSQSTTENGPRLQAQNTIAFSGVPQGNTIVGTLTYDDSVFDPVGGRREVASTAVPLVLK